MRVFFGRLKRPSPEPGQQPGLFGVVLGLGQRLEFLQQLGQVSAGRIEGHAPGAFVEAHRGVRAVVDQGVWAVGKALGGAVAQVAERAEQDDRVHALRVAKSPRRRLAPPRPAPASCRHPPGRDLILQGLVPCLH